MLGYQFNKLLALLLSLSIFEYFKSVAQLTTVNGIILDAQNHTHFPAGIEKPVIIKCRNKQVRIVYRALLLYTLDEQVFNIIALDSNIAEVRKHMLFDRTKLTS